MGRYRLWSLRGLVYRYFLSPKRWSLLKLKPSSFLAKAGIDYYLGFRWLKPTAMNKTDQNQQKILCRPIYGAEKNNKQGGFSHNKTSIFKKSILLITNLPYLRLYPLKNLILACISTQYPYA